MAVRQDTSIQMTKRNVAKIDPFSCLIPRAHTSRKTGAQ